jgi:glycosyltransferase involved in cell wall biosynthesis
MKERGLSLVIPCHNSERVIAISLNEYDKFFSQKFKKFEMIVICNDCTDNTAGICKNLMGDFPLKVLEIPARGKGHAILAGFKEAKYDVIGFLDADNPFDLSKIINMVDLLDTHDGVIVTKFKKGNFKRQVSFTRRLFSIGGSIFSKVLFDLDFNDTQAGAKFINRPIWERINKNFFCRGFEFDIELLYRLKKINADIKEYFILPRSSDISTVKLRILPGIIFRLIKLRILK